MKDKGRELREAETGAAQWRMCGPRAIRRNGLAKLNIAEVGSLRLKRGEHEIRKTLAPQKG